MQEPQSKSLEIYNQIVNWASRCTSRPDDITYWRWKSDIAENSSPNDQIYHLTFGILETLRWNVSQAIEHYKYALEQFEPVASAYASFIVATRRLGYYSDYTKEQNDRVLCLFPNNPEVLHALLNYTLGSGDFSQCRSLIDHIGKVMGENSEFRRDTEDTEVFMDTVLSAGVKESTYKRLRGLVGEYLRSNELHFLHEGIVSYSGETNIVEFAVYPHLDFDREFELNDNLLDFIVEQWGDDDIDWMSSLTVSIINEGKHAN